MRHLERLPEPDILIDKKELWKNNLIKSGKKRPDSNKYGHKSIRLQLNSMSHQKCFYCESKLKELPKEVDHHIEVSFDKKLSYEWTNLYLSCQNCNKKIPHSAIPVHDVLDPCEDTEEKIRNHLTFHDEIIQPNNNSELGLNTIKKFRLDTELLENLRLKKLKDFYKVILEIRKNQNLENRQKLNLDEYNLLVSFTRIDSSYSRMFEVILRQYVK